MALYKARLLTQWLRINNANEMKVSIDHPFPLVSYTDITMQSDASITPTPNVLTVEVFGVNDAQLTELESDTNITVLWSEVLV